jgi:hypothetical protein
MPNFVYNNATPPRKLYVLRRISTNEILNRFVVYPNAVDDAEIVGLDPDLEYLAIDRDAEPTYEARAYSLVVNEAKVGNLWRITYSTPKRPLEQIKQAIQNHEITEMERHISHIRREKAQTLMIAILSKQIGGVGLTVPEANLRTFFLQKAANIRQNDVTAAAKIAEVDAGGVPDFEAGWAPAE